MMCHASFLIVGSMCIVFQGTPNLHTCRPVVAEALAGYVMRNGTHGALFALSLHRIFLERWEIFDG